MLDIVPRLVLRIMYPPNRQEFPPGVEFEVRGTVSTPRGELSSPITSVSVRIGAAVVEAALARPEDPRRPTRFSAMVQIPGPGQHRLRIFAKNGEGLEGFESLNMATPGVAYCSPDVPWNNYPRTLSSVPRSTCVPETVAGIAGAIQQAEDGRAHAFGSKWSFSDCAITYDRLVDTASLNRPIQTVQQALRADRQDLKPLLFHVEAGMRIYDVYETLDQLGLALETMGGAAGQTLAGAISTGTHGGDKHLPPLADSVLAIHLVGAGGTQYWIEPTDGITDPDLLRQHVAPEVDPQNILYDDDSFNACLVSLGCMGVIYAFVLRARMRYDLVETTTITTWNAFRESAAELLGNRDIRFLQLLFAPYPGPLGENLCLQTTRTEDAPTVPVLRKQGPVLLAAAEMLLKITLENPFALPLLLARGAFDLTISTEERMSRIVDTVLGQMPGQRHILVESYDSLLAAGWPTGTIQGLSYSVMDLGYHQDRRDAQPGYSLEISFRAIGGDGGLDAGLVTFMDELITIVNASRHTFFSGYMSLRFSGPTRAFLGMQQWDPTCSIEISTVQGVRGLLELLGSLYAWGLRCGGVPHWGQMVDIDPAVRGHGNVYSDYNRWREIYARMSAGFTVRTFENDLSVRWRLTTPALTAQRIAAAPLPDRRLQLWATDASGGLSSTWKLTVAADAEWAYWSDFLAEAGPVDAGVLQVAAAPLPDGRLELWAVDRNGGLLTTWKVDRGPNSNWTVWADFLAEVGPLPNDGARQVAVARLQDRRLELWAVDGQGGLQTTWKTGTHADADWSPWSDFLNDVGQLDGGARQVAVAPLSDGRLQLWAITGGGGVVTTWKVDGDPNGDWSGWSDFLQEVGALPASPTDIAVAVLANRGLQIWITTDHDAVYSTWKTAGDANANWSGWSDFLAEV